MFVGVRASGLIGIDDCEAVWQLRRVVRQVVIGDDQVKAQDAGLGSFRHSAYPGIDADDETHAGLRSFGEDGVLHSVALANAMRDMVGNVLRFLWFQREADALDGGLQQNGGSGPINVIVAVYKDRLRGLDGSEDPFDGRCHAKHLCRIGGG